MYQHFGCVDYVFLAAGKFSILRQNHFVSIEIIPANSISLPFVGKYLMFTMIMVTMSVFITVVCEFFRRDV